MSTIALIALEPGMLAEARTVLQATNPDVRLAVGLMGEAVAVARGLAERGVEVVISRGATARLVRAALPDLSVVDIATSGLDLLRAIHKAGSAGARVGVVAFPPMSAGAREMGAMLGIDVAVYELAHEADIEPAVLRAREEGAGVIVGGYITAVVARRLGAPCQPVETSPRSLLEAVAEARRIAHGRGVEKAKSLFMRTVLTNTDNGILAVDDRGRVTVFNQAASRLLRMTEADALSRPVAEVWPRSGLPELLAGAPGEAGRIERVFDQEVVCGRTPIVVRGLTVGAVATFHEVRQIQKMEATVRRRILAAGHVATSGFKDIVGESPALRQAIAMSADYARTSATVLIHGETGTGKELFAQGIHNASERRQEPFVAVNCAALPGQLLESELFGYVPGAFTGASQKGKPGLFELAHGGTIFLDEIAEMDLPTQARLLRVLQEKKVMRLGSDQVIPVDVRVVAATNRDIASQVGRGDFRDDLYYRLNVLRLRLPPLRERTQDVPLLAKHCLEAACGGQGRHTLSPTALEALCAHPWPGNIRELQNVMSRVAATHKERFVSGELIGRLLDTPPPATAQPPAQARNRNEEEARRLEQALARCNGRIGEAAKLLGVSRCTLWRKMKGHGLS